MTQNRDSSAVTVDLDEVWRTVSFEVPALITKLAPLLPDGPSE